MSTSHYDIYIESVKTLARSIVIKHDSIADYVNKAIAQKYGDGVVDYDDPKSWKYYQNIAGLYHPIDEYELSSNGGTLSIYSLDNEGSIELSRESMKTNPKTFNYYRETPNALKQLYNQNLEQYTLILGVMLSQDNSHSDLERIVNLKDSTICHYRKDLVEPNEISLIDNIQKWLTAYNKKWFNPQYVVVDEYYLMFYLAQLTLNLIPLIINLRLKACKTNEAHSYHVRQYLASHGMLDKYINVMTLEQRLFLYRNILYIETNAGKKEVFDWLATNIMTNRNLPIYEYRMKHLPNTLIKEDNPIDYLPEIKFTRKRLVDGQSSIPKDYTLNQLLAKMQPNAIDNTKYNEHYAQEIHEQLRYSESSTVLTKVVESEAQEIKDPGPYSFDFILVNHLFAWILDGTYKVKFKYSPPGTKNTIDMSSLDMLYLLVYAYGASTGVYYKEVPKITVYHILKNRPNLNTISYIENNIHYDIDVETLESMKSVTLEKNVSETQLKSIIANTPNAPLYITSETDFYLKIKEIHKSKFIHFCKECACDTEMGAGEIRFASSLLFEDRNSNALNEIIPSFDDWITSKKIWFSDYTDADFYGLATDILKQITGISAVKEVSVKTIQKSMIEIMKTLCSYSIQFISDVNEDALQNIGNRGNNLLETETNITESNHIELVPCELVSSETVEGDTHFEQTNEEYREVSSIETSVNTITEQDDINIIDEGEDVKTFVEQPSSEVCNIIDISVNQFNDLTSDKQFELFELFI